MIPIRNRKKTLQVTIDEMRNFAFEIGRAHVRTPVTEKSRMPSSA